MLPCLSLGAPSKTSSRLKEPLAKLKQPCPLTDVIPGLDELIPLPCLSKLYLQVLDLKENGKVTIYFMRNVCNALASKQNMSSLTLTCQSITLV